MRSATAVAATALCLAIAGCGDDDSAPGAAGEPGAPLFAERCGSCHAIGEIDPARVPGAIANPPEGMPENLANPEEATQISDYVTAAQR